MYPREAAYVFAVFAVAATLRITLISWGNYQDVHAEIKYTDVDYWVFTDGAREIMNGRSPYERATYRYTPLMGLLTVPSTVFPDFGKLLFAGADLVMGFLLLALLRADGMPTLSALAATSIFLLSPVIANVSTRGSGDVLVACFVAAALLAMRTNRTFLSGFSLGVAVHMKLYPLIYALPLALQAIMKPAGQEKTQSSGAAARKSGGATAFVIGLLLSFGVLSGASWWMYRSSYLHNALTYHLSRADPRHNFSPYFYAMYLQGSDSSKGSGMPMAWLAFAPQIACMLCLGMLWSSTPPRAVFLQTVAFVALNKVVTAQYFTWWMALLPLALPAKEQAKKCAAYGLLWLVTELGWNANAYILEIEGQDHFRGVWLAGLLFLAASTAALIALLV